ncbi:MAG TPA: type II secretion system protein [Sulfurovum sp.]|jgi:type II secretory pathway pseudopilin PulG|nr:MAG: prepilin-type cleavage/methylation domain-containing protein [Sulfurovum sp. 24-42-9]OZA59438.1 MAG: prepilin-type cleavage/methylation domain-containing protein [Sulfurovum sp. 39-42-12]HQR73489.1 type II secretion system protein [Sulfurovum sp.]HQS72116.1 type II secretion system protein [Sulfurovum sp.]HQS77732.1 type II secretion system protein [Sulfurovum sp.]
MKGTRLTAAFSMLELIFVIIILGIVASIGSEMIAKVYEGYIIQRAEHSATLKTELAASQIANRLASAIPGTVYRIKNTTPATLETIESDLTGTGDDYVGLQWVGSDAESFNAASTPGWSGFCDINTSTQTSLETPGSALGLTTTIKNNLSSSTNLAVYFPDDLTDYNASISDADTLTLSGTGATRIVEHYKLAWSSYALVVEGGDLYLYYNFNPTPATALGTTKSLLMKNVATFKFQGGGRTIRFKICKHERISDDVNITACKEKAVF